MNDRDVLDCQGEGEWTIEACWTCRVCWTCQGVGGFGVRMDILRACQSVGGFGVRMNMSMGVLGHSELVGARDGYRNKKIFGQDKSKDDNERTL